MTLKQAYEQEFGTNDFEEQFALYENTKVFNPDGNVFEDSNPNWNDKAHFIMRFLATEKLKEVFKIMKIDLSNPNVAQDLDSGNIGSPGRVIKVWNGADTHDDSELGGGRFGVKPRIASFPNNGVSTIPITKRVDITSNCSHHFLAFSTAFRNDSYAVISYIPGKRVLGISKLQRIANWVSQRFFLQEDLTKKLYEEVSIVAETEDVLVAIINATHSCEKFRGARTSDGAFTSMYYGGKFKEDSIRNSVLSNN